jgi:hypothetical protein
MSGSQKDEGALWRSDCQTEKNRKYARKRKANGDLQ